MPETDPNDADMAGALKDQFCPSVPGGIAKSISAVLSGFDADSLARDALRGYHGLALAGRAIQIAQAMRRHLLIGFFLTTSPNSP